MVAMPQKPTPTMEPARYASSPSTEKPLSSTASWAAARAYCMNRSIFLTSLASMKSPGSKPSTWPPMRLANDSMPSMRVMGPMPERPA